jgi:hypothetical protein
LERRFDPPELTYDSVISSLETLVVSPEQHHEANVLAHEYEHRRNELAAVSRDKRQGVITNEVLAKRWHIGLEAASRTLRTTIQEGMCFVQGPME